MSFLLEEISNLKRSRSDSQSNDPTKKYVKRSHFEEKRVQEYEKAQSERDLKRKIKELAKLDTIKKEYKCAEANEVKVISLPEEEVKKRLRLRRQPITLFGESREVREERLLALEFAEPNIPYEKAKEFEGSEYLKKLQEMEDENDEDLEVQKKKKEEIEDLNFKIELRDPTSLEEEILFFFREAVRDMGLAIEKKNEGEKMTASVRQEVLLYGQLRSFIKPLFVDLQAEQVPSEVLQKIGEIVSFLKKGEYAKASDTYYKMAIGNAAWPIGITGIGIHERSAHERIAVSEVGHILNDETQRKYIQAIKRLMTFVQNSNPHKPSKRGF
jgi:pre-mRNA-splicing factor 18